jgi:hypothetical protein
VSQKTRTKQEQKRRGKIKSDKKTISKKEKIQQNAKSKKRKGKGET